MQYKKLLINRPLTPHITVYSNQITSNYSIWHRITGIALLTILFLYINLIKINFLVFYIKILKWDSFLLIENIIIINIIIIFIYHVLSGIKHIKWDLNYGIYLIKIFRLYLLIFLILFYILFILILKIFF